MSTWKTASLGEIFEIARGGSPRPIQDYLTDDPNGVNWISISDASASSKFITATKKRIRPEGVNRSRMVKPGDFLLTNSMSFGRPYIMGTNGCIHDGWLVLSSKHYDVDQDYFFQLLSSDFIYAKFSKLAAGATVKNLNIDLVSGVEVTFPPLEEQRRIAAILDQAETLRTQRRTTLALLDSLTQSLFLDMFGDPVANPKGLPICELRQLCTRITDGTHQSPEWQKSGIPFLFISNIVEGQINFDTHKFISADTHAELTKRCPIEIGDVLYTTVGSYGNAAVVSTEKLFAFQRHIAHIKPDRSKLDSCFLAAMIKSPGVRQQVDKVAKGIAQKTVNLADLKELSVFAPPLPLQQTFATRIASIEALKATHRRALAALDALFASLQQRAFSGELTPAARRASAQSLAQLKQLEASIGQEALIFIAKRMPDGDLYNSLKAIYFADRHHLEHHGRQIYNETYSALRHGPVPQAAYDATEVLIGKLMLSSFDDGAVRAALRRNDKKLTALRDADFSKLSRAVVESLEWGIRYCRDMKFGETKTASHDSAYERTPKNEAIPLC